MLRPAKVYEVYELIDKDDNFRQLNDHQNERIALTLTAIATIGMLVILAYAIPVMIQIWGTQHSSSPATPLPSTVGEL